jgi:GAF domain-containing protein
LGEAVKRALHQRALHEEKRQALTALRESEERFRTRYQETEALRQAALALVSTVDVDQVFEGILENLQNVVPFDSASLQLLEENRLKIIGGRGFPNLSEIVGVTFGVGPDTPNAAVLKTQQPVIIDDVSQKYPHIFQGVHALAKVRSWLGTPLQIGNRLIGMLTLDKQQPNFYTKNHARITQAYAAQATIAIENARLYKETENRMEQLAVLHDLDQAISTSRKLDEVYQAFAKYTAQLLAYDYLSVILKKNGDFFVAYLTGISQPSAKPEKPLPLNLIEWVFDHGQPFLHRDIISDYQFADETILQAR